MTDEPVRPATTPLHEPVNGWLHFAGALLAVVGLVVLVRAAADRGSGRDVLALAIFGASAVLMFAASALNHLTPHAHRPPLLQRLDHAMIYVYIAGTYTPVCLLLLPGSALGTALLIGVWAMAAVGAAHKVLRFHAPRGLSTVLYLGMGWLGLLAVPALRAVAPPAFLALLIGGGVLYSVGAVVYWRRWPRGVPGRFGFHEVWHLFVLAASGAHYWAILGYVVPPA